jgi:phage anti-repressor protein
MNELIKVTLNQQQQQVVSARELYEFLGLNLTQWKRWCKRNIELNQFHCKGEDWELLDHRSSDINYQDYAITIDFAKHLSMMAKTSKANEARIYFIQCEKTLKEIATPKIPQTYGAALLEAGRLALELENTQIKLLEANKTVSILTHVSKQYTATEIAKELGFNSAIELNKLLHTKQIQFNQSGTWVLYSKYSNLGYVDIKQEILDSGRVIYHRRWTQTGREFLVKLLSR